MTDCIPPLPLASSTFATIRANRAIYVDKTAQLFELCRDRRKIFLARPPGFGKSLLVSTFGALFRDGLRYFAGLSIEKLWTDKSYQVIHLDFSRARQFDSVEQFEALFDRLVREAFLEVGQSADWPAAQKSSCSGVEEFIDWLSVQPIMSVVLLIDEYDAPLVNHLDDPILLSQVQSRLADFYSAVKAYEGSLRFFFMTGVTKLVNTDAFADFNNVSDLSMSPTFGSLLGFTEDEIRADFEPYIESAAQVLHCTEADVMTALRLHYGGYCFDEQASACVYCPKLVLAFLERPKDGFQNYWFKSVEKSTMLKKYLTKKPRNNAEAYAEVQKVWLDELYAPRGLKNFKPASLLFQEGYLTIRSVSANRVATLGFPNEDAVSFVARLNAEGADRRR